MAIGGLTASRSAPPNNCFYSEFARLLQDSCYLMSQHSGAGFPSGRLTQVLH